MSDASRAPEVIRLSVADRPEVLDVLVAAFRDYPVMRFVLGQEHAGDEARLRALIGFFIDLRLTAGWPVLGVREEGRLVAVTLVNEPTDASFADRFGDGLARLREQLGPVAYDRMARFEGAAEENEPTEPHYFVGMVGVLPSHQGRGLGRRLLEAVRDLARSSGVGHVALSTEDAGNVPFYLHLGLQIVGEKDVDELHTWGFRWPV